MSGTAPGASAWKTLVLLLRAARQRSLGRSRRQRLMRARRGGGSTDWGRAGAFFLLLLTGGLHASVAGLLAEAGLASRRLGAEVEGRRVVSQRCLEAVERVNREEQPSAAQGEISQKGEHDLREAFRGEAREADEVEDPEAYAARLLAHYRRHGRAGFVTAPGSRELAQELGSPHTPAALLGALVLLGWFVALALQGEGVELDLQRRRHPMWEWLLGHPVDVRAVFLGEMLSPLAANPVLLVAPIFWIRAFWIAYDDLALALVAGLAAGLPICVAAGCIGKAIEIVAVLRLPPRNRGAVLGLLAWLGQAVFLMLVIAAFSPGVLLAAARQLPRLVGQPNLPLLQWVLGLQDSPSPWKGVVVCWVAAIALIALAAQFSAQATRRGLAGDFTEAPDTPGALARARSSRLLQDPAYRKEVLWVWRDRGALVHLFLVPLTVAAVQLFNFRGLLARATQGWHLMAGASVVFGSYFLFILGPRSLLSEGAALWLPFTWPRGLEELLKAKARLFWLVSLVLVGALLLITMVRFPAEAWKVALVGLLFVSFGRSLAEKGVTLVSAPSSAGEPEPVPLGRRWAASLGTLTFGAGILTQQWHVAVVGVVYSWITSAAMWQNLRARLPHLLDPWSERLPDAPTLMHAMVAISAMTEAMAVLFALLLGALGPQRALVAQAVAYGVCGIGAWLVMGEWLASRGVFAGDIWPWGGASLEPGRWAKSAAIGPALGFGLGVVAMGYSTLVQQLPGWGQPLREASERLSAHPVERLSMALMAVAFAPIAEEYLFRGLLFRALDREWGGAKAIWGSACFFAVYHPPQSWLPVVLVGAVSAALFKRGGHLLPCVLLHMVYNAVVVWAS